ncbi:hypothetical protein HPB51_024459 [Rhipicephalus microplus]|uniref:Chaperone DnaJ C-terminal domain-containing protein n=1 Tax=Rhipicephalus microplus TaxID=6941 RepID=A0A9J6DDT0_RHIMP|nr:hypothetical protein HPB51_024459 [Rhipicephalus microplus]
MERLGFWRRRGAALLLRSRGAASVKAHLPARAAFDIFKAGSIKGVRGEGMPIYRNPLEKGNLYIKFDVEFPENHFAGREALQAIEVFLGEQRSDDFEQWSVGDSVDVVDLLDYDPSSQNRRQEAYHEDEQQPRGSVECAHQ